MIDEKKLLAAFIYSAYASGYCGKKLGTKLREEHKELYRKFVAGESDYYPKEEIKNTQEEMMREVGDTTIRDYIYQGHYKIVQKRIGEEFEGGFEAGIQNKMVLIPATFCPTSLYEITEVSEGRLRGRHLFLGLEKELVSLKGLEQPRVGDKVLAHWNYMLEIANEVPNIEEYERTAKEYFDEIKKHLKN